MTDSIVTKGFKNIKILYRKKCLYYSTQCISALAIWYSLEKLTVYDIYACVEWTC